jgi:hypothetical protein
MMLAGPALGLHNHRHTIVDRPGDFVGAGGDEGTTPQPGPVRALPDVAQWLGEEDGDARTLLRPAGIPS